MKITHHHFSLELKEPFVISHGTFHFRDTLIIEVEHKGIKGYGEATAITYYGMNIDDFISQIEEIRERFEKLEWKHPEDQWLEISTLLPNNTFLQSAVDCAIWDIWGKIQGIQLHEVWSNNQASLPKGSFTLSGSAKGIRNKLQVMDWPLFKLKLGTENDEEIIEMLQNYQGKSRFIVDANGGWNVEKAHYYKKKLKALGIHTIEQPLPPGQEESMPELVDPEITWFADESAQGPNALTKCDKYFDGINFKLMKSGGITPVIKGIKAARERGLKVALGCMTESSFGISAVAQLAPLVDAIDMDGNLLIKNDPGEGVLLDKGEIKYGQGFGIGCRWK